MPSFFCCVKIRCVNIASGNQNIGVKPKNISKIVFNYNPLIVIILPRIDRRNRLWRLDMHRASFRIQK